MNTSVKAGRNGRWVLAVVLCLGASLVSEARAENQRPVADAGGPYKVNEGRTVQFDGSDSYDPDGAIVFYTWSLEPGGHPEITEGMLSPLLDEPTPTFTPPVTIADRNPGAISATFKLQVQDNMGFPDSNTTTVTVNRHPTADAGDDQDLVEPGEEVTLHGEGSSDPDGDGIEWLWEARETAITLTGQSPTFMAPALEEVTFDLTVTEQRGDGLMPLQAQDSVIVTMTLPTNIIYVDESGYGDFLTINEALSYAQNDPSVDVIEVLGSGTYAEDIDLTSYAFPDVITLRAHDRRSPAINGRVAMANGCTLEGFKIETDLGELPLVIGEDLSATPVAVQVAKTTVRHNTIVAGKTGMAEAEELIAFKIVDPYESDVSEDDIVIHNNIVVTKAYGDRCVAKGIAILQDPADTSFIEGQKVHIINNTIDVTSDGYAKGLYVNANNLYVKTDETLNALGIVAKNNIVVVDPGLPDAGLNYCVYKTGGHTVGLDDGYFLPIRYNNLYVRGGEIKWPDIHKDRENGDITWTHSGEVLAEARGATAEFLGTEENIFNNMTYPPLYSEEYHVNEHSVPAAFGMGCINAGDPCDSVEEEPEPNGNRINMGAYGGTNEATIATDNPMPYAAIVSILNNGGFNSRINPALEGDPIDFEGAGFDPIDEYTYSTDMLGYRWTIECDTIARVKEVNSPEMTYDPAVDCWLRSGTYTVTLQVQDLEGKWSIPSDPIPLYVDPGPFATGDINHDGYIDFLDLKILHEHWLLDQGGTCANADIAPYPCGDGIVNLLDFAKFAEDW